MAGDLTIHADSYYESFSVEILPGFSHGQLLASYNKVVPELYVTSYLTSYMLVVYS